jgi:cytochrome c oxidase cbb3-type subunit I/II
MLNQVTADGLAVKNTFLDTLQAIRPLMGLRVIGGGMFLLGWIVMCINLWKTIRSGKAVNEVREVAVLQRGGTDTMGMKETFFNDPTACTFGALLLIFGWIFLPPGADVASLICAIIFGYMAVRRFQKTSHSWANWYESLLHNYLPFTVLTFVAVVIGGLIQIIPTVTVNSAKNVEDRLQKLYEPLELAGRDIYVSEGCYNCHSQMIRTLVPDVMRYGDYSRLGESIYDHPFQWGSKRTGPDLAREGGQRPDSWHYEHLMDPRSMSPQSNMPPYAHLSGKAFDQKALPSKIAVLRRLGVPYPPMDATEIKMKALEQGVKIATELKKSNIVVRPDSEMVAVIAYLQKLGQFEQPAVEETLTKKGQGVPFPLAPIIPDKGRRDNGAE